MEDYDYSDVEGQNPEPVPTSSIPNMISPPMEQKEEEASIGIIRELSPRKVLEQLRMNLKGYFYDYEADKYMKIQEMKPLMNDKGISKYLSIMGAVITDLVTFSNYKEEEINSLVMYVCEKAIPTIHINYKEYGIREKSDLQIIDIQIFNLTLAAFKKAVGGGDRSVVRGGVSESIVQRPISQGMYPERRGFFQKINPFSR